MKTKICASCKKEKLLINFYKDNSKKDNLRCSCKDCENKRKRKITPLIFGSIKDLLQKRCSKCNKVKWIIHFACRKISKDGFYKQCKDCLRKYQRNHRKQNPIMYWKYDLRKNYGITSEDYLKLFNEQKGCCYLCGRSQLITDRRFCVDHNHRTGKIRGLLCNGCNSKLGWFEKRKYKILNYLKKGK